MLLSDKTGVFLFVSGEDTFTEVFDFEAYGNAESIVRAIERRFKELFQSYPNIEEIFFMKPVLSATREVIVKPVIDHSV